MKKVLTIISSVVACVLILFGVFYVNNLSEPAVLGSISDSNAYEALVTATGITANKDLIKTGSGTLGSVVITGAAAGTFEIYDATTTNSTLRTITATSSLKKLASFPTNAAAGTYTFDVAFTQGMIVAFTGTQGTTTITWR